MYTNLNAIVEDAKKNDVDHLPSVRQSKLYLNYFDRFDNVFQEILIEGLSDQYEKEKNEVLKEKEVKEAFEKLANQEPRDILKKKLKKKIQIKKH